MLYFHQFVHRLRQTRSLSSKLLLPLAGLMLASLLGSVAAFVVGTARTEEQLLSQQTAVDVESVENALAARTETIATAARMLAHDRHVAEALHTNDLSLLNSRAVVVRDRLELDLVQIYDQAGEKRTNLVTANLYQVSSLLNLVDTNKPVVRIVGDHLLLLNRTVLPGRLGTVLTGLDLETELHRIVTRYRLPVELGLHIGEVQIDTRPNLAFDPANGSAENNQYSRHIALEVAGTPADLVVTRPRTDTHRVLRAGLTVMIGSTLITTLLLLGVSIGVTRAITRPVRHLAAAAQALARGDLSHQVEAIHLPHPFNIGKEDEIGWLTQAFNNMVAELRELYADLESKVEARTRELAAAAEVAHAASSSLDLVVVLRTSVELIRERFGFYHASVFIIEPGSDMAVLREATSEAGQALKASGHQLAIGSRSLVGAATATHQPRIVQDVLLDPTHFKNPLLPSTRAEAVIPLLIGDRVIGALDVQSTQINAFSPDTVALLTTLANQIAVAIQNARLYTEQRAVAQHLAEVDQLKMQFLANMSHELRTPLNSIIGFSRLLLKGIEGPLTDLQRNDLMTIQSNGQHLLSLINNILDFSKIEAGQMELHLEELNLAQNIQTVMSTAAALIKDKPISLKVSVPDDLPLILADGTRVRQVLLNLLSNAVKFTEQGSITVSASYNHHLVTVSVTDTGIGIPADKLTEIFEEFIQIDGSSTRRAGGTGLGLPISKKLIEMHGGQIWVESQPDQGSTFTFTLPINKNDPPATESSQNGVKQASSGLPGGILDHHLSSGRINQARYGA